MPMNSSAIRKLLTALDHSIAASRAAPLLARVPPVFFVLALIQRRSSSPKRASSWSSAVG